MTTEYGNPADALPAREHSSAKFKGSDYVHLKAQDAVQRAVASQHQLGTRVFLFSVLPPATVFIASMLPGLEVIAKQLVFYMACAGISGIAWAIWLTCWARESSRQAEELEAGSKRLFDTEESLDAPSDTDANQKILETFAAAEALRNRLKEGPKVLSIAKPSGRR